MASISPLRSSVTSSLFDTSVSEPPKTCTVADPAGQKPAGYSGESSFTPADGSKPPVEFKPPTFGEQMQMRADNTKAAEAMQKAGVQPPEGDVTQRSAQLGTVPADKQPVVASRVRRMLDEKLSKLDDFHRAQLEPLKKAVGTPDFYKQAAKLDPAHADDWNKMADVQKQFAAAEPGYDAKTRAYSESMRLTLQAGAVMQFASDPNHTTDKFSNFIAGHVTAFRENGGWLTNNKIGAGNSASVLWHTPSSMYPNIGTLTGAAWSGNDDVSMRTSAEMVRRARTPFVTEPAAQ